MICGSGRVRRADSGFACASIVAPSSLGIRHAIQKGGSHRSRDTVPRATSVRRHRGDSSRTLLPALATASATGAQVGRHGGPSHRRPRSPRGSPQVRPARTSVAFARPWSGCPTIVAARTGHQSVLMHPLDMEAQSAGVVLQALGKLNAPRHRCRSPSSANERGLRELITRGERGRCITSRTIYTAALVERSRAMKFTATGRTRQAAAVTTCQRRV